MAWTHDEAERVVALVNELEAGAEYHKGPTFISAVENGEGEVVYRVFLNENLTLETTDLAEARKRFIYYCQRLAEETIRCAAVYVDDGKSHVCMYGDPHTGLVFPGQRHPQCFMLLDLWRSKLTEAEIKAIEEIDRWGLRGHNQGFLTSVGRFVDREEAGRIAFRAGQTDRLFESLTSEDLY